jgi:hypothetical protein
MERFEWHYTPKHGSWLDMAESELDVLATQCLDRRIPEKQTPTNEIAAWETTETAITPKPIGKSQPTTPVSNSSGCTLNLNDSGH